MHQGGRELQTVAAAAAAAARRDLADRFAHHQPGPGGSAAAGTRGGRDQPPLEVGETHYGRRRPSFGLPATDRGGEGGWGAEVGGRREGKVCVTHHKDHG